jgi:hypothetical protein
MKKPLPYIILGVGIGLLLGCYFFFKNKIKKMLAEEEEPVGI